MLSPERAIAVLISARRKDLKITQAELGDASGITGDRIGRLERGEATLHFKEVPQLAAALRWSTADFQSWYLHYLGPPELPPPAEPRLPGSEIRDSQVQILDLTDLAPGSRFGIRIGDQLLDLLVIGVSTYHGY